MKVIHVVPHIDKEAAGPSYSIPRLCQSLAALGDEVELTCLAARGEIAGVALDLHCEWPILRRFSVSSSLGSALWRKARTAQVVHNHSLWSMPNVAAGWAVPGRGARLVTSPRGTLAPVALARQKHLKRMLWPLQRRVLQRADLLHATSDAEYRDIRAQGFTAPVALIPNGIDVPPLPQRARSAQRTLLYLGRLHPIKGIDRLLRAWTQVQHAHPDWRLLIAGGGDEAYVRELQSLVASLAAQRVVFAGALYGAEKSQAYANADLFILPTHTENFGMVVAEALAHGCPAIVSRGAPWSGLETEACGWWIPNEVPELSATLGLALRLPTERLQEMGSRGRGWMEREFGWASVGERMHASYQWLLHGGERPACVRID